MARPNTQGGPGKKILLAEDEPSVSKAIKMLLEYEGHKVLTAENGEDALMLYTQERFDLVITDFSLAGMNGGELAACIKTMSPDQPIILSTASIYKLDKSRLPGRSVDYILNKPFGLKELREAIASLKFPKKSG